MLALAFLIHGLFVDEGVRCAELGASCVREQYELFLNDERDAPLYQEVPIEWLKDPPHPFEEEDNPSS